MEYCIFQAVLPPYGKKRIVEFPMNLEGSQIWVIKKKGVTCPLNSSTHLFSHEVKNTV